MSAMIKVQLETADERPVIQGRIPAYEQLPDVIHWGLRTFVLHTPAGAREDRAIYRECFAVSLVDLVR